jgi:uncharacterized protein YacL
MLWVVRAMFLVAAGGAAAGLAAAYAEYFGKDPNTSAAPWWVLFGSVLLLSAGTIALDTLFRRKHIATVSAIFFGLIVGLILSSLFQIAFDPVFVQMVPDGAEEVRTWVYLVATLVLSYICVSLLLQTQDQFRFVIPYVEFSREVKGFKPLVLDTSVIIDGRIADVCETHIIDSTLIVPRFVLAELQAIADSPDKLRRNRGRRGLDMLNKLRSSDSIDIQMHEGDLPELTGQRVDQQVVLLAKHLSGKVVTNDYNLNKMARVQGVDVINLNDIANALKPVVLPGEGMRVKIVKPGEETGQGVGYLDDGTMVVVEGGRTQVGHEVGLTVTSVLQTSAGRMIFGKMNGVK